ncbi:MBL fold metallo-hydrolase [Gilliamella apicola]|uniref:MBL fold metallo-hydrolase n=1 Tax=Gilliamella apicola TaxID=1196095 RepID=UPI003985E2C1
MIKRIFFPIGQGAFYAEKHDQFNIVYDCGNYRKTKLSEDIVKQSFNKNDDIDILFISHLDWDHISLLKTLKESVNSIRKVILPLLHNDIKILLKNIYHSLGYSSLDIIDDPEKFFRDNTKIIYISPSENNRSNESGEEITISHDNNNLPSVINSGTAIKIRGYRDYWCFVPYNIKNKERIENLKKELKKAGLDMQKLITDPDYAMRIIIGPRKDDLKKCYKSLEGKINENSLVIYSGPIPRRTPPSSFIQAHYTTNDNDYDNYDNYDNYDYDNYDYYYYYPYYFDLRASGCIYTGDVDLNKFDIKYVYKQFWNTVGTVQIPHHGSIKNFEESFLKNNGHPLICPISYGIRNSYGHPSLNVVNNISLNGSFVIHITEDSGSKYIQLIDF